MIGLFISLMIQMVVWTVRLMVLLVQALVWVAAVTAAAITTALEERR